MTPEPSREAVSCLPDQQRIVGQTGCETRPDSRLVLRLHGPRLTVADLQGALSLLEGRRQDVPTEIVVDFSEVDDVAAPWSVPFAILIHLSRKIHLRVRGLHGQPFQVAWLYRRSSEIRKIVDLCGGQRMAV